jgi:predicted nucleic acid-binding Zn ribbon protein
MERKCLECGDSFHGRADKKFCSDQCRNAYNNKLKSSNGMNFIRRVNGILVRNRNIMDALNPGGKTSIHRSKLLQKGFRNEYMTHTYTTRTGRIYYFCYDQGYTPVENDFYVLVRREVTEGSS